MSYCVKCGKNIGDNLRFCPNCGNPVGNMAPDTQTRYARKGGPLFWRIYGRAFTALMEKPFRLWGISLLGGLLIVVGAALMGVAIPILGIAVAILFTVALAGIFLKGYHREQVHSYQLFDTFKDGKTIKRVLAGMGWSYLWIFLWALIPIVGPIFAIIKSYAQGLVPYILVERPELNAVEARELSIEKTKGYKGQMFLADLVVGLMFFGVMLVLGLFSRIPYIGVVFGLILGLVDICVSVLLPLFMGLVRAAFYEELIGRELDEEEDFVA